MSIMLIRIRIFSCWCQSGFDFFLMRIRIHQADYLVQTQIFLPINVVSILKMTRFCHGELQNMDK